MTVIERILKIVHHKKLSDRAFEISIDKSSGYLNMLKKRRSNPGVDVVLKIVEVYPDISLTWLMTGEGLMYEDRGYMANETTEPYHIRNRISIDDLVDQRIEEKLKDLKEPIVRLIMGELEKDIAETKKRLNRQKEDR